MKKHFYLIVLLFASCFIQGYKSIQVEQVKLNTVEKTYYKEVFIKEKNDSYKYDYNTSFEERLSTGGLIILVDTVIVSDLKATYKTSYWSTITHTSCQELLLLPDSSLNLIKDHDTLLIQSIAKIKPSGDTIKTAFFSSGYRLCFIPYKIKLTYIIASHSTSIQISESEHKKKKNHYLERADSNMNVICKIRGA